MKTEKEARDTRCCGPEGCGQLRSSDDRFRAVRFCIASDCMAWEWGSGETRFLGVGSKSPGKDYTQIASDVLSPLGSKCDIWLGPPKGDCGLKRGKP